MNARMRVAQLKKWAPRYIKIYHKIYGTIPNGPGPLLRHSAEDRSEFEHVSAEVEEFLACDACGSGGIEDAQYMLEHPEAGGCKECEEFVKLWNVTPEIQCYTWRI